jgi:signal transduction histidine kinase
MPSLVAFLRASKDDVLREWETQVRSLPAASDLSRPALRDHMPELVERLADAIAQGDETATPLDNVPAAHAVGRIEAGYDLRQVIAEYRVLRDVICQKYTEHVEGAESFHDRMTQIRVLNEALDYAIANAVDYFALERDRSREMLISILGHDLRTPLSAIAMAAQLLLRGGEHLEARDLKVAARIANSADRMARMISDLLDFTRGRMGSGLPITRKVLNLQPLVMEAVQEIANAHPDRDIRCSTGEPTVDFEGEWDGDRIVQAISNLVGNAIQHGHDPIVVQTTDSGAVIEIEVRNRGMVPEELHPTLFDAFVTRAAHQARRSGLGLGLFIVREIAKAHGGEVRMDCSEEETSFMLLLPRSPPA